jgi:hypothetical protein
VLALAAQVDAQVLLDLRHPAAVREQLREVRAADRDLAG